MRRLITIKV